MGMYEIRILRDGEWTNDIEGSDPEALRCDSVAVAQNWATSLAIHHQVGNAEIGVWDVERDALVGSLADAEEEA